MSFQPPPSSPPPGAPPPPPAGPTGFDPSTVNPLDWGILGAGLLAFIFSFISYYTIDIGPASDSTSAWHGFFGWFAALLAIVGAAAVGLELFMPQVKLAIGMRLAGLGAFALATLCVIIALFTNAYDTDGAEALGFKVDSGHGFGYWASLIVIIAGTVLSLMRLQATGGRLPGALGGMPNIGGYGPQDGAHRPGPGTGTPPPPPPASGPPQ